MAETYTQFSSGFYGAAIAASQAVVTPFQEARVARLQYDSSVFDRNPKDVITLNKELTELYKGFLANSALWRRNFDNREAVIIEALRVFGSDFTSWYIKHSRDHKIDQRIIDFIEDTARFILTGQRQFPLETWKELIKTKLGSNSYREVPPFISQLTHLTSHNVSTANRRMTTELIQIWLQQQGGFADLLQSLYVMFGPHRDVYA